MTLVKIDWAAAIHEAMRLEAMEPDARQSELENLAGAHPQLAQLLDAYLTQTADFSGFMATRAPGECPPRFRQASRYSRAFPPAWQQGHTACGKVLYRIHQRFGPIGPVQPGEAGHHARWRQPHIASAREKIDRDGYLPARFRLGAWIIFDQRPYPLEQGQAMLGDAPWTFLSIS